MKENKKQDGEPRKPRLAPYKRVKRDLVSEDERCDGCGKIVPMEDLDDDGMCPMCCKLTTDED